MVEKKDCKIVQDLLPNYIENLTKEETNIYIEQHLNECNECNKILENMNEQLKLNNTNKETKKVNYIKKFNNKINFLKTIIIIIVLIFIIVTGRKIFIISKLSNKAEENINIQNYHKTVYSYNMGSYTKTEIFSTSNRKKLVTTEFKENKITTKSVFAKKVDSQIKNGCTYLTNTYIESEDGKKAILNQEFDISVDPQNSLYTENYFQLLIYSIFSSVKSTTFNGEECYYISNFQGMYSYSEGMYINKDTGLVDSVLAYEYKNADGSIGRWPVSEYTYEFNTVDDNDFIEPNINEYETVQ